MKTILQTVFALALILVLSECSKAPSSSCHTCTQQCLSVGVLDMNNQGQIVYTDYFCGPSAAVSAWKTGINTTYSSSQYSVNYTPITTNSHTFCGTTTQNTDSIAAYATLGYGCN